MDRLFYYGKRKKEDYCKINFKKGKHIQSTKLYNVWIIGVKFMILSYLLQIYIEKADTLKQWRYKEGSIELDAKATVICEPILRVAHRHHKN